jgi:hypothetical protein
MKSLLSLALVCLFALCLTMTAFPADPPAPTVPPVPPAKPSIKPTAAQCELYTIAQNKAIADDKPLVVTVGFAEPPKLPDGTLTVSVPALDGFKDGDIVICAPADGKLFWCSTGTKAADVCLPTKVMVCDGQKCTPSYFPATGCQGPSCCGPMGCGACGACSSCSACGSMSGCQSCGAGGCASCGQSQGRGLFGRRR